MTVSIRPVPSRVAGNRIVPFGRVQYSYRPNHVGLRDWKPPVPEPLQPAPLLGLGTLAVLGLQALAWAWGQLNGRQMTSSEGNWQGPVGPDFVPVSVVYGQGDGTGTMYPQVTQSPYSSNSPSVPDDAVVSTFLAQAPGYPAGWFNYKYSYKNAEESTVTRCIQFGLGDSCLPFTTDENGSLTLQVGGWFRTGQTEPEPEAVPIQPGPLVPEIVPAPLLQSTDKSPLTLPDLPLPFPSTTPQTQPQPDTDPDVLPAPSPLVPVTPGPVAPPIIQPATPFGPWPPLIPATTGTSNGNVIAPAPVQVPVTSPTSIIPWPGASPIGTPGQAPRADLASIAQEVGKIERKLELMNDSSKDLVPDSPRDLLGLARLIYELLRGSLGAPTYQLDSPCEVDGDGDKLPPVLVPVAAALTSLDSLANRMDALAELLQVHKNLKQPNCHIPRVAVGGEFVTVNFEQID
jgi:hypothetical protein